MVKAIDYDLIVWGASGFTGKWVAEYLHSNYSQHSFQWAIAGRNKQKLTAVLEFIGASTEEVPIVLADGDDIASLYALLNKTKLIITTVGPYALYGEALLKACVETGTHYVDLSGEVPWMRTMIDRYHAAAQKSGARIVHCCGFDSIPSDIGVYYLQRYAKQTIGAPFKKIEYALMKSKGGMSGGTVHSMVEIFKQAVQDTSVLRVLRNPYALNPDASFIGPEKADQNQVQYHPQLDAWTAPFIMSSINTRVVRRSNALMGFPYTEQFRYTETLRVGRGLKAWLTAKSISASMKFIAIASASKFGRRFLQWILPKPGEGPQVDKQQPGFYHIRFMAHTEEGQKYQLDLLGDADPGYGSTSKILSEAALCLLNDSTNITGGFWTPASAMGDALIPRLEQNAGIQFKLQTPKK